MLTRKRFPLFQANRLWKQKDCFNRQFWPLAF
jgi:hypothetical protein